MTACGVSETQWSQLSALVGETIGLHFPPERRDDLERGLAGASRELGFDDTSRCIGWLLSRTPTRAELQVLASHLTIGETYFFRDEPTMAALLGHVLPELIRKRRSHERRLRIWSAACCTGEEPYSLAILLHQLLPDLHDWQIAITGTDINSGFLQKAALGVYTEWAFRNTPAHVKARYFERSDDGRYAIVPEIRKLVSFSQRNLVEDVYGGVSIDSRAVDLILCRNALMYFTPAQMQKVVGNLHRSLADDGWLAVSPSELSQTVFARFATVNLSGAILYRKSGDKPCVGQSPVPEVLHRTAASVSARIEHAAEATTPVSASANAQGASAALPEEPLAGAPLAALAAARALYERGHYAEVLEMLLSAISPLEPDAAALSLLARALANQGRLAEALTWCERWIAADKLDAAAHYTRAVVLMEQGDTGEALSCLQRAVYLEPDFVMAHFALGNLARVGGHKKRAQKHFHNALHLLRAYSPDDLLPEAEGLTVGRLSDMLTSMSLS